MQCGSVIMKADLHLITPGFWFILIPFIATCLFVCFVCLCLPEWSWQTRTDCLVDNVLSPELASHDLCRSVSALRRTSLCSAQCRCSQCVEVYLVEGQKGFVGQGHRREGRKRVCVIICVGGLSVLPGPWAFVLLWVSLLNLFLFFSFFFTPLSSPLFSCITMSCCLTSFPPWILRCLHSISVHTGCLSPSINCGDFYVKTLLYRQGW